MYNLIWIRIWLNFIFFLNCEIKALCVESNWDKQGKTKTWLFLALLEENRIINQIKKAWQQKKFIFLIKNSNIK
jgi:hypothetical protein